MSLPKSSNLRPGEHAAHSLASLGAIAIRTQKQVAALLGTTPQNIQQIERRALLKLRRRLSETYRELTQL